MNISKYKTSLERYGIDEKLFKKEKGELTKKFKKEASDNDVIWSFFNQLIVRNVNDLHNLKMIYYEMALFLDEEGKNSFQMRQQSSKMELLGYQQQGIDKVRILSTNGCESCKKQDKKVYTIRVALEKMPIPCKHCTYHMNNNNKFGFCRCNWLAEFD